MQKDVPLDAEIDFELKGPQNIAVPARDSLEELTMLTGLIFAVILGSVWGFFWGGVDAGIARLTRSFIPENQIVQIVRMIVSGYIAQDLAVFVVALVFGVVPGGPAAGLIALIMAALLWFRSREFFSDRLG